VNCVDMVFTHVDGTTHAQLSKIQCQGTQFTQTMW